MKGVVVQGRRRQVSRGAGQGQYELQGKKGEKVVLKK